MGSITDALKAKGATGSNIAECIETLPSGGSGGGSGSEDVFEVNFVYDGSSNIVDVDVEFDDVVEMLGRAKRPRIIGHFKDTGNNYTPDRYLDAQYYTIGKDANETDKDTLTFYFAEIRTSNTKMLVFVCTISKLNGETIVPHSSGWFKEYKLTEDYD